MTGFAQLWLPILLSAVGVFIASSILHMLLKFWHMPDYHGFANEDDVREAIRRHNPKPGMYALPHCRMEDMQTPETREKFAQGPVGLVFLRANGMVNMGLNLALWFGFCVLVSLFAALIAGHALPAGASGKSVFHVVGLACLMAYGFGSLPMGIWWGQPWSAVAKDVVDGLIYAVVTAAVFTWLWP